MLTLGWNYTKEINAKNFPNLTDSLKNRKATMKFCICHSVNKSNVFIEKSCTQVIFVYYNERKQKFQDKLHKIRILKYN